jgi:hypothetical protein
MKVQARKFAKSLTTCSRHSAGVATTLFVSCLRVDIGRRSVVVCAKFSISDEPSKVIGEDTMKLCRTLILAAAVSLAGALPALAVQTSDRTIGVTDTKVERANGSVRHAQRLRRRRVIIRRPAIRRPAIRRPALRRWNIPRRRHFGRVIGGITLGTVIAAVIIGTAPRAPSPDLCWNGASAKHTHGYWYHCEGD